MLTSAREATRIADRQAEAEAAARPCRILHVIMRMDRGGIEVSLMQLLRTIDRRRYQMDFLALAEGPGSQDEEVRALGSRVIAIGVDHRRPVRLARRFDRIMRDYGPYDVIHSHVHFYGGYVLRLAARHGIPLRIAHSRNDTRVAEQGRGFVRQSYVWLMRRWIRQYANFRIAISRMAAEDLFGDGFDRDGHFHMIYSGRDFSPYSRPEDRAEVRQSLGLPADAFVLGHVGRFYRRKNHRFVLEVAAELFKREPRAWLLLVGDGPDQAEIEALARSCGIADRVIFTGPRADVRRLLKGAMDAFIFPSHHEGLGMAVVEAQAAGLPCVIANTMPEEIDVIPELIHRLPLHASPALWTDRILGVTGAPRPRPEQAYQAVHASEFTVERSTARLCDVYDTMPPPKGVRQTSMRRRSKPSSSRT
jgi:glycosyltransferase involved in cell wall biosynthesis